MRKIHQGFQSIATDRKSQRIGDKKRTLAMLNPTCASLLLVLVLAPVSFIFIAQSFCANTRKDRIDAVAKDRIETKARRIVGKIERMGSKTERISGKTV